MKTLFGCLVKNVVIRLMGSAQKSIAKRANGPIPQTQHSYISPGPTILLLPADVKSKMNLSLKKFISIQTSVTISRTRNCVQMTATATIPGLLMTLQSGCLRMLLAGVYPNSVLQKTMTTVLKTARPLGRVTVITVTGIPVIARTAGLMTIRPSGSLPRLCAGVNQKQIEHCRDYHK